MQALHFTKHGKDTAKVGEVPVPGPPGKGELLVRVHASSINPADFKSAEGEQAALMKFKWPRVYGFDFSGEVEEVGEADPSRGGESFSVGDKVFGMISGLPQFRRGTVAEKVIVDADICARCPTVPDVGHSACASLPLVGITAFKMFTACGMDFRADKDGKTEEGKTRTSPRVLVLGGAGGVGTACIQIAKHRFGASFVATTASAGVKTDLVKRLGADRVVNYREEKFEEVLAKPEGEASGDDESHLFDVILDTTGEAKRAVRLLRKGGGLCSILAGENAHSITTLLREARVSPKDITFGIHPLLHSSLGGALVDCVTGASNLRKQCKARGATFAHIIGTGNGETVAEIANLLEKGTIRAVIDRQFPLAQAVDAVAFLKTGRAAGKVVVNVVEP